jgi:hypothetical protein
MMECIGYIASNARVTASDEPGGRLGGGAWKAAVLTYFTEGTEERSENQYIRAPYYDWNRYP